MQTPYLTFLDMPSYFNIRAFVSRRDYVNEIFKASRLRVLRHGNGTMNKARFWLGRTGSRGR